MFTTHCFIRKNTPELRNKLQDIGYRQNIYDKNEYPWLAINHNIFISVSNGFERLPEFNIDCGENEDLFLALAALRDDSDYMQWFVCPKTYMRRMAGCFGQIVGMDGHYREIVGYEWHRYENNDNALTTKLNEMIQIEGEDTEFLPHKASVEELIKHFTMKEGAE